MARICQLCQKMDLKHFPKRTERKQLTIVACPYCDKNLHRYILPKEEPIG